MNITTPETARLALEREVEITVLASQLRVTQIGAGAANYDASFEQGARAGLTAYRECYELCVLVAALRDTNIDDDYIVSLVERAEVALESAR